MSYILEGLKKLEQKRRQEEGAPGFLTFNEGKAAEPKKRRLWPYLIFIALLLNAGVIVWWVGRPAQLFQPVPGPIKKAVTSPPVEIKNQNTTATRKELPPPKAIKDLSRSPALEKAKETVTAVVKKPPASKKSPGAVPVSPESQSSEISKIVPEGRIVKLNDLPSEIKKSLPAIKMSVHFYSPDKQARFATINDRTLHEGETLSEGLRVVEISPEGTVFSYRGHRFLIGVNEHL